MASFGIFDEFATKVDRIITGFSNRHDSVMALRNLADGKSVHLPDTEIEPLSGIGLQRPLSSPSGLYLQVMTRLLDWGMRQFPVDTAYEGLHLWLTMSMLDGPHGYNQLALPHQTSVEGLTAGTEQGRVIVSSSSQAPGMVPEKQTQPVRPLQVDLGYVKEYLIREPDAGSVVATAFRFGWENVSVQCVCLSVNSDKPKTGLTQAGSFEEAPTIIVSGQVTDLMTTADDAAQLMGLRSLDTVKANERLSVCKKHFWDRRRMNEDNQPPFHGQSISVIGDDSKGSVGVFLSAEGSDEVYALTACHLVNVKPAETRIISPAFVDICATLARHYPVYGTREPAMRALVEKTNHEVYGNVVHSAIGTTKDGWRSDWALVRLRTEYEVHNGEWFMGELQDLCRNTDGLRDAANISGDVLKSSDPKAGWVCVKDGATTGCTVGVIGQTEAVRLQKGTANGADGSVDPTAIEEAKFFPFFPTRPGLINCDLGDSGAGVFYPIENGWAWGGLLVSKCNEGGGYGLMIPQSAIFSSLTEETGLQWHLAS